MFSGGNDRGLFVTESHVVLDDDVGSTSFMDVIRDSIQASTLPLFVLLVMISFAAMFEFMIENMFQGVDSVS